MKHVNIKNTYTELYKKHTALMTWLGKQAQLGCDPTLDLIYQRYKDLYELMTENYFSQG